MKNKDEKGTTMIALTMVVLGLVLMIGTGVSFVHLKNIRAIEITEDSIKAFYAANSGVERMMINEIDEESPTGSESATLKNNASFEVEVIESGEENCYASFYCIDSTGIYGEMKRMVRVVF